MALDDTTSPPKVWAADSTATRTTTIEAAASVDAARAYVRCGWKVTPIPHASKDPGTKDWPKLDLTESELPSRFIRGSNIGLILGERSGGLVDVDLDCPQALLVAAEILPPTGLIHGRPSKPRSHYWYIARSPEKTVRFKDPAGRGTLVELRSTGGQTVVPPSTHPNGEALAWSTADRPAEVEWKNLLRAISELAAVCALAAHWPSHSRHDAALALSGFLVRRGCGAEEVKRLVRLVCVASGDEERPDRERAAADTASTIAAGKPATGGQTLADLVGAKVLDKVSEWLGLSKSSQHQSAIEPADWERPTPFTTYDPRPFPVDQLPDWLADYVKAEATATQTPPDLAGMLAIAVSAASVSKKARVQMRPGYQEPLNLYCAVVLQPGGRKSGVCSVVSAPIIGFEARLIDSMRPEIAESESRHRIDNERLRNLEKDLAKADNSMDRAAIEAEAQQLARYIAENKKVVAPQLLTEDCSPEKLSSLLYEQDGRMAVISPEGDVFDLMAGRYSKNGGANLGVYLKGHSGDEIWVDRMSRGEHVKQPALTMGLAVQPEILQGLMATRLFLGRGLVGRFLYSVPRSTLGSRNVDPPTMPPAIEARYRAGMDALLSLPLPQPDIETPLLKPDHIAYGMWIEFCNWLEPKLAQEADLGHMSDWAGKLTGAVVRLAGILHIATHVGNPRPWDIPIGSDTMGKAIELGAYLLAHAQIAYAEMGADPEIHDAQYLANRIQTIGQSEFTTRDLFQRTKGRFKKMERLLGALEKLVEHGYVRIRPASDVAGVGRPLGPTYEVNPALLGEAAPESFEDFENIENQGGIFETHDPTNPMTAPPPPVDSQNSQNPQNTDQRSDPTQPVTQVPALTGVAFAEEDGPWFF